MTIFNFEPLTPKLYIICNLIYYTRKYNNIIKYLTFRSIVNNIIIHITKLMIFSRIATSGLFFNHDVNRHPSITFP